MLSRTEYRVELPITANLSDQSKVVLNKPSGNFFYDPWEIKEEYKNTVWEDILNSLPLDKGEARIIKLAPGTTYVSHTDIDDRWHLTLQAQRSYLIDLDSETMYPTVVDGIWYSMNTGKRHVASNFGSIDRLQLVVRQLLTEANELDMVDVKISPAYDQHDYRYYFDDIISPWLNILNKQKKIAEFKHKDSIVCFKLAKNEVGNIPESKKFRIEV